MNLGYPARSLRLLIAIVSTPILLATDDTDALIICVSGDKAAPTFSWMDDWDMGNAKEDVTRIRVRQDGSLIYELENANGIASPILYGNWSSGTIINGNDGSTPLETGSFHELVLTAESIGRLTFEVRPWLKCRIIH